MYNDSVAMEMNEQMRQAVLPVAVFVGIEAVIGFVGNIVVLYVFLCMYHVCNFRYFVLCLATVDLVSTVTTMPGEVFTQLHWYVFPSEVVCKVKSFFNMFTVTAEAVCLLCIAIDRYRKICQPLNAQIKPTMAKFVCLIIICGASILSVPVPFLWGTNTHPQFCNAKGMYINVTVCELDKRFKSTNYSFIFVTTMMSLISACLFGMCVAYIFVAKQLICRHVKTRYGYMSLHTIRQGHDAIVLYKNDCDAVDKTIMEQTVSDHLHTIIENPTILHKQTVNFGHNADAMDRQAIRRQEDAISGCINDMPTQTYTVLGNEHVQLTVKRRRTVESSRIRRKTLIMFILTFLFVGTTVTYLTLLAFITKGVLLTLSDTGKTVYFFFFRLVFVNHIINPFVYGWLDTQFKNGLKEIRRKLLRM